MNRRSERSDSGPKARIVWLGAGCNNNCKTCPHPRGFGSLKGLSIKREADEEQIIFVGREPAIQPGFIELVSKSRDEGYKVIEVVTNGRIFSVMDFAREAVEAGLTDVLVKFPSVSPAVHDSITRAEGSWRQTVNGIRNLMKLRGSIHPFLRPSVVVGIYVSEWNLATLPETLKFLDDEGIEEIFLIKAGKIASDKLPSGDWRARVFTQGFGGPSDYGAFRETGRVLGAKNSQ